MTKKNNQSVQGTIRRYEKGKLVSIETISEMPDIFSRITTAIDPVKSTQSKSTQSK